MEVPWEKVHSSAIDALAYDEDEEIMYVRYKDGGEWAFDGVSYADYEGVKGAGSVGRALQTIGVRGRRI